MDLFSNNSPLRPRKVVVPQMPSALKSTHQNDEEIRQKERQLLLKQLERFDDNVKHAILLSEEKSNKTEFYRKLESLAEKIHIYKNIFYTRSPSFTQPVVRLKEARKKGKSPSKRVNILVTLRCGGRRWLRNFL